MSLELQLDKLLLLSPKLVYKGHFFPKNFSKKKKLLWNNYKKKYKHCPLIIHFV